MDRVRQPGRNDDAPRRIAMETGRDLRLGMDFYTPEFPPESKMREVLVLVTKVFKEQPSQMAILHGDDMIQQVLSATFNPTLCHTVLPGTLVRVS